MISVGTCGYAYDDWRGAFYPNRLPKKDFLSFYVRRFGCLELNSSYYAIPSPSLIRNLTEHTPDNFQVAVKAYRGVTHELRQSSDADLQNFLLAIAPLHSARKLACVLLQFPHSFSRGQAQMDYVAQLVERVQPLVPVVEFRNSQWMDPEVWQWLRELDTPLCCVDEPQLEGLLPPETVMTSTRIGYVRFHGRNADKWYKHEHPDERYDYLYTDDELRDWERGIRWLGEKCEQAFVFFNNHRGGQAVRNAGMMEALLGIEPPAGIDNQQKLL